MWSVRNLTHTKVDANYFAVLHIIIIELIYLSIQLALLLLVLLQQDDTRSVFFIIKSSNLWCSVTLLLRVIPCRQQLIILGASAWVNWVFYSFGHKWGLLCPITMDLWCTAPSTVPCLDVMPPPPGLGDVICCRAWMCRALFLCWSTCCKPRVLPVTMMPNPCAWLFGARWAPLALCWGGGDVELVGRPVLLRVCPVCQNRCPPQASGLYAVPRPVGC